MGNYCVHFKRRNFSLLIIHYGVWCFGILYSVIRFGKGLGVPEMKKIIDSINKFEFTN